MKKSHVVHGVEFALVLKHQHLVLEPLGSLKICVSDADFFRLRGVGLGDLEYPAAGPE